MLIMKSHIILMLTMKRSVQEFLYFSSIINPKWRAQPRYQKIETWEGSCEATSKDPQVYGCVWGNTEVRFIHTMVSPLLWMDLAAGPWRRLKGEMIHLKGDALSRTLWEL